MFLSDLTAPEVKKLNRDVTAVLIPMGTTQQHGPHLPLSTQSNLAEMIAYKAGENISIDGLTPLITPTINFIPSNVTAGFNAVFSVAPRTFSDMLYDIGRTFAQEDFKYLYFVNLSISPETIKAIDTAINDLSEFSRIKAFDPLSVWNFSPSQPIKEYLEAKGLKYENELYADIKTTSAMLAINPSFVKTDILSDLPPKKVNIKWEMLKGNFSFLQMGADNGYIGTPSMADPELGKLYLDEASLALSTAIKYTFQDQKLPGLPLHIKMLLKMIDLDEV
ncbi:MAG: creatininase family protein [Candidatus Riflebacteria bacterium]|nr:creatininase family protein [Candidatus Riflebacteria bacterium]